ncbi:hypothetical protein KOR42_05430 [Thalassoglobus neptunius]|uniref:Uncharacterized protein n=1 Tax=Thalassoglobus neptunius TaxID=1938619 RepID=A0A5C5X4R5_9PLAN|nr:inverse autotransporter beta domain-containing protein [Thalassoglobus neptunius]TWT57185.1 hypothetical protein KOR42_05430 [Thalassoglobus neptunius]
MPRIDLMEDVRTTCSHIDPQTHLGPDRIVEDVDPPASDKGQTDQQSVTFAPQDGTRGKAMSLLRRLSDKLTGLRQTSTQVMRPVLKTTTFAFGALAASVAPLTALAEHQIPPGGVDYTMPSDGYSIPDYSGSLHSQPSSGGQGAGGVGTKGRVGHQAGDTVGRNGSLTYFDLSPYIFTNSGVVFGDGRLFVMNSGKMGGSAGLGARHFFPQINTIGGATFYYDRDDSRGVTFEQFTIAGEILSEFFDVRANYYIPFGNTEQVTAERYANGSAQFVEDRIEFQTRTFAASALEGLDLTFTTPIQGEFFEQFNMEASAGWYHYKPSENDGDISINGWKIRLDADIAENLSHTFLKVTHDNKFNTSVVWGIDLNYWNGLDARRHIGKSQFNRLASWVRRERTVSALSSSVLNAPEVAINPETGDPYVVLQVRNNPNPPPDNFPPPTGNGSLDMPYQYIQDAIDDPRMADIVFVQGNSVFDGDVDGNSNATVVMREGLLVLGEGVPLDIPVQGPVGTIPLPTVTEGPVARPIIQNVSGPVVTLADNSRFAGFTIQNFSDGPAILADGVSGSTVNEVIIDTSTGAMAGGIEINDSTGTFTFQNISISDTAGNGLAVTGGNAAILFNGTNSITNSLGYSVLAQDAAGSVNLRNTTITEDGGLGVEVSSTGATPSTANVTFNTVSLSNTNSPDGAFRIFNHGGAVSTLGAVTIDNPDGAAIVVDELQATGTVSFQGSTTITNRTQEGILVNDIQEGVDPLAPDTTVAGSVIFQGPVSIGQGTNVATAAAIDMNSSLGNVVFGNLTINGGAGDGISITDLLDEGTTVGQFFVNGFATINDIQGTSIDIDNVQKTQFSVSFQDTQIANRGGTGINISDYAGLARFFGLTQVGNGLGVTDNGVTITDNLGVVAFGNLTVVNQQGAGSFGVLVADNVNLDEDLTTNITFNSLNVESFDATAVSIQRNENVAVATGTLDATDATAIEVFDNTRHDLTFQEVSATNSDYGIFVSNSPGSFVVTGIGTGAGTGGLIQGMSIAGAHFDNTNNVFLQNLDLDANLVGVEGEEINLERVGFDPSMILNNVAISNSASQAAVLQNVTNFSLLNSFLTSNGNGNATEQILFNAAVREVDVDGDAVVDDEDDLITYNVNINGNTIMDASGASIIGADMVLIQTTGAGNGAPLIFNLLDNGIPGLTPPTDMLAPNRTLASGIHLDWDGDVFATMDQNTFVMATNAGPQTAVEFDIDGLADVTFTRSSVSSSGVGDRGLQMTFTDQASLIVTDNVVLDENNNIVGGSGFQMTGNNSEALNLTFQGTNNNFVLSRNLINMTGFDSSGVVVERIFAPSNVTINSNSIFLTTDFDNVTEYGILFRDVRGVINLFGNQNNDIPIGTLFPFYVDFQVPQGSTNGSIIVNGTVRP